MAALLCFLLLTAAHGVVDAVLSMILVVYQIPIGTSITSRAVGLPIHPHHNQRLLPSASSVSEEAAGTRVSWMEK